MKKLRTILMTIILVLACGSVFADEPILLLFGGSNHDKFLGCLN